MIENREETKREIRPLYVVVVQRRQINVQKKCDERAGLLSFSLQSQLLKLPNCKQARWCSWQKKIELRS